jgi:hypothetical protein
VVASPKSGIGLLKLGRSRQLAIAQFVHLLCEEGQIGDDTELIDCGEGMLILGLDLADAALRHHKI